MSIFVRTKKFSIISNKKNNFNCQLVQKDKFLEIFLSNDKKDYKKSYSLFNLKQKGILKLYDSIEDIISELNQLLFNKSYKLIEETNKLILNFEIPLLLPLLREIKFEIHNYINNKSDNNNNSGKNDNNNTNYSKNIINNNENNININSEIIKTNDDINFLSQRFQINDNISNNEIKYNLIYRATIDGSHVNDFHDKVNGKSNQLIIIKTTKNLIFGGYTKKGFQNSRKGEIIDNDAFIFSVNLKKIYNVKKDNPAIFDNGDGNTWGPFFGDSGIDHHVFHCGKNKDMFNYSCQVFNRASSNYHYKGFSKDYEINDGQPSFCIKELEVFKVIFE